MEGCFTKQLDIKYFWRAPPFALSVNDMLSTEYYSQVIVNKLHRKKVVGRWSVSRWSVGDW